MQSIINKLNKDKEIKNYIDKNMYKINKESNNYEDKSSREIQPNSKKKKKKKKKKNRNNFKDSNINNLQETM